MQMTKRDIADIALVWILSSVFLHLLMSIALLSINVGMTSAPTEFATQAIVLGVDVLQFLVLALLCYVLLFKRAAILSFLFPDGREKEIAAPAGMEALASYAFWIRLFGIFEFLSSGVQFIGNFARSVVANWQFLNWRSLDSRCLPELVCVILAAGIVWKADWIAEKLQKIGTDKGRVNDVDAKNP